MEDSTEYTDKDNDSRIRLRLTGDFELVIGSDSDAQVRIPGVAPRQAALKRMDDRLFLKMLGADDGAVVVNRNPLRPGRWIEVTRYDEIAIAGVVLSISPKFFLGRDRVGIDTTPLRYMLAGKPPKVLVDGPYLHARPGTFTALLGPAGGGKTVLLSLLNGYLAPTEGRIAVGDHFDPRKDRGILRDFIGYVPQDDVLIPDLTVRQSLDYRLSLKFPDMAASTKVRLIQETCRMLGLRSDRTDMFLDTVIGSPDGRRRGLSGGERRRANIAHELITRPLVLILDEPTSGLSSADAVPIIQLLHRLAKEESLTVIASLHQPGARAFGLFDDLMVLCYGGRLAYYGPAREAVEFFQDATGTVCDGSDPAEYILDKVTDPGTAGILPERFEQARETQERDYGLPQPLSADPSEPSVSPAKSRSSKGGLTAWLAQWPTLVRRNLRVQWSDRLTLALSLLQSPLIGLMIFAAFQGVMGDAGETDELAASKWHFDRSTAEYKARNATIPTVEKLWREAREKAYADAGRWGLPTANRLAAVYFVLVAAGIWFGTLGSCREIVGDQRILRREFRTCVRLLPFLGAKAVVQILLTGTQSGLLVLTVFVLPLDVRLIGGLKLWAILWLVSATAAALGLLVSCLSSTPRVALTMVPLLMIPQLLFGGILRPPVDISDGLFWPRAVSLATIERHGFQLALEAASPQSPKVLVQEVDLDDSGRYGDLNILTFRETGLARIYFSPRAASELPMPILMLVGGSVLFLLAGYIALRIRFS